MVACEVCGRRTRTPRSGPAICGDRACRYAWLGHNPRAAQSAHDRHTAEEAGRLARTHSPELPVVMLPSNDAVTSRMPAPLRERFLAKLRARLPDALAQSQGSPQSGAVAASENADGLSDQLIAGACATCRGKCCASGRDHAHLDTDSLAHIVTSHGWTAAEALAAYAAHVPRTHYRDSCVYHGTDGCALPRDMRSDVCNRHLCGSLTQIARAMSDGARAPFFAVAANWRGPTRAAIISNHAPPVPALGAGALAADRVE